MYSSFDFQDRLFDLFSNDEELCQLLEIIDRSDEVLTHKYRREDMMPDVFSEDLLDFIAFYFVDGGSTGNYLANEGLMRIDIYAKYRGTAGVIRSRCVNLLHNIDVRIVSEGQKESGISNVYKYRLEILPLISS